MTTRPEEAADGAMTTSPEEAADSASPALPATVQAKPDVVWQEVQGQVVLLDLQAGHYWSLDAVGSRMWQVLQEHPDVGTAVADLLDVFEVDEPTLRRDLVELIGRLVDTGLLSAEY